MIIELNHLTRAFGSHRVLDAIDARIGFRHVLALLGASGCGKFTLLRLLAGLDVPDAGEIVIDGSPLPRDENSLRIRRARAGIVFQAFNLFPHLTALENLLLPLEKVHGMQAAEARERSREVLSRLGLKSHADKRPSALSGGQRQRVAIARALAISPSLLLLDEPTSALDPEMTGEVLDLILELRDSDTPLVLVTHEIGFAKHAADQIVFLAEGGISASQPTDEFFNAPASEVARRFLTRMLRFD